MGWGGYVVKEERSPGRADVEAQRGSCELKFWEKSWISFLHIQIFAGFKVPLLG